MKTADTIDDIFLQLNHYESRGTNIVVTHPVIRDITEDVLEEKMMFAGSATIPKGTKYFGFFDQGLIDVKYILASSLTDFHSQRSEEEIEDSNKEKIRSTFDKIGQLKLCENIGIFEHPRYLDVRKLFTDAFRNIRFNFIPEEFTDFPYDLIIGSLGQSPKSYIFHNVVDGFRIKNSKDNMFTISGKSEAVKEADKETKMIKEARKRLDSFLEKLTENHFSLAAVGCQLQEDFPQEGWITKILKHTQNLYIKDARTGGGYLVVRIRKDGKDIHLESDSPDFVDLLNKRADKLRFNQARYDETLKSTDSKYLLKLEKQMIDDYRPDNTRRILMDIFMKLRNPIIQEEVPFETYNDHRAEFRYICQRVQQSDPKREMFDLEGYAKVSANGISANIALGGHGEKVKTVLKGMYAKRLPNIPERELTSIVLKAEIELAKRTQKFADGVFESYLSDKVLQDNKIDAPRDFAIDLIPYWDESKQKIDFYFLEINHNYGFKGLEEIDIYAAVQVGFKKALINEIKTERA